jgi:hypothetical protein
MHDSQIMQTSLPLFNMPFELEKPLPLDANRVTTSARYQMIIKDGKVSEFTICEIEADDAKGANAIADAELNEILGLLTLHCRETPIVQ